MDRPEPRTIATWSAPVEGEKFSEELIVSFDRQRASRLLILPALFDEANKLRRFTIQTMRALDENGIDCFLPDLPGQNESLASLEKQTLASWRNAAQTAAEQFSITHVLSLRAGCILAPDTLPGWQYAPQSGPKMLKTLIRARTIASRETGNLETADQLLEQGRKDGLMLGGWPIGAQMLCAFESTETAVSDGQSAIAPKDVGAAALWLRAEPDEDQVGAINLAQLIADELGEAA